MRRVAASRTSFAPKLTTGQREAVVRAVLVGGMTHQQAADAAARGELHGVPKFQITKNYVGKLARGARGKYATQVLAGPGAAINALDDIALKLITAIEHDVTRVLIDAKHERLDLTRVSRQARVIRELKTTLSPGPGKNTQPKDTNENPGDDASKLIDDMLQAAKAGTAAGAQERPSEAATDESDEGEKTATRGEKTGRKTVSLARSPSA